jgi:hypothetical protein
MKYLFLLLFQFAFFYISAQDTLFLKNGNIQVVEIVSVNTESGIIIYKYNNQQTMRAISSLKRYTNHASVGKSDNNNLNNPTIASDIAFYNHALSKNIFCSYSYSKFSVGINLLSSLSSLGSETNITIASNYNQSFYGQFNFNKNLAIRLPARIGFAMMTNDRLPSTSNKYKHIAHDIVYEIGLEPLFMVNDKRKINPYILPGIYFGKSQGVRWVHADSILGSNNFNISVGPRENYYRLSLNIGVQFNLSKYFALNFEAGGNINTAFPSPYAYTGYARYENAGGQAAINLVYRFKAKDQ